MERLKIDLSTQRIKPVLFDRVSNPGSLIDVALEAWEVAGQNLEYPLVQVRGIVPLQQEQELLNTVKRTGPFSVVARIPFNYNQEPVAIYYVQGEVAGRPGYKFPNGKLNTGHNEAINRAREKNSIGFNILPSGYVIRSMVPDSRGDRMHALKDNHFYLETQELAKVLVETHKVCFEYPHDVNQENEEEVQNTLKENPIVLAFDSKDNVAAVGYIEKDERFVIGSGLTLVEPTYWTLPEHRRAGISHHLRQEAKVLFDELGDTVCFGESVRPTSFVLILASGYNLAGTQDLSIPGNLGDAYTAIGPANPNTGYIPMGASYYTSQNTRVNPGNRFILNGVVK